MSRCQPCLALVCCLPCPRALHAAARSDLASPCSELSSDVLEEASAGFWSKPGHRSGPAARSPGGSAHVPCLEGIRAASAPGSKRGGLHSSPSLISPRFLILQFSYSPVLLLVAVV